MLASLAFLAIFSCSDTISDVSYALDASETAQHVTVAEYCSATPDDDACQALIQHGCEL